MRETKTILLGAIALLLPLCLPLLIITVHPFGLYFPPLLYPLFPVAGIVLAVIAIRRGIRESRRVIPITLSILAILVSGVELAMIAYLLVGLSRC